MCKVKETFKRDLECGEKRHFFAATCVGEKRLTKETYTWKKTNKRDLQKRSSKETRVCEKRFTKETDKRDMQKRETN